MVGMTGVTWPQRPVGRTGLTVTPLALGGAHLGYSFAARRYDPDLAVATVLRALELGLNVIDTSPSYGPSEEFIGRALAEWCRRGGRRADLVLSTKTGSAVRPHDYRRQHTLDSVARSRDRLQTDYLDIVHVHDPETVAEFTVPGGALETLRELREAGVVRAIGLGVRDHHLHRACILNHLVDVVLTYGDYHLLDQSAATGVLAVAAPHGVGVFNAGVVMGGLLGGDDPAQLVHPIYYARGPDPRQRAQALWQWCREHGVSLLNLNLQYCLREARLATTLVGAATPAEIAADVAAATTPVAADAWAELHERFGIPLSAPSED